MMLIPKPFKQSADFTYLQKVILRQVVEGPVPIIEMMADGSIMGEATGMEYTIDQMTQLNDLGNPDRKGPRRAPGDGLKFLDLNLAFSKAVGYDSVINFVAVPLTQTRAQYIESEGAQSSRPWQNEHNGLIPDRAAFNDFTWPDVSRINTGSLDYMAPKLPPGMKIHVMHMGVFEDLRALMGFEPMAIKSIEEPELLGDILEKLTDLKAAAIDRAAAHPAVGAVFYADDMGFKTSTMLSPKFFREWIIPCQKRIADACHTHGKLFLFHSCGYIDTLMEDLIEVVKIDAIHSFEDVIEPVESVFRRYGDRVGVLGGVDVNLLAQGTPQQVRSRCREILDACGGKGGFALGSGNSITNYCKVENFYAMIDEARIWNEEKGFFLPTPDSEI
jgi:uroporphyrinogen decarboxylase